jgi:aryl-alcohol dehydrogenase
MVLTRALVTYGAEDSSAPLFKMEELDTDEPGEYELLVQMVATGLCHSDITVAGMPGNCPKILGHEGECVNYIYRPHACREGRISKP